MGPAARPHHSIWTLPPADADYSRRWAFLKKEFTKAIFQYKMVTNNYPTYGSLNDVLFRLGECYAAIEGHFTGIIGTSGSGGTASNPNCD